MKLTVNGEEREFDGVATLDDLVSKLELDRTRIAAELNKSIVRKAEYAQTSLSDGDRLEIVTLVGGG